MTRIKRATKKFLAMFLTFCLLAGMLPQFVLRTKAAAPSLAYDADSGVYTIRSAADWQTFVNDLGSGFQYPGKTVVLQNDINVTSITMPTDYSRKTFSGVFDGLGHTLTIKEDNESIFPIIYQTASVKNLNVVADITLNTSRSALIEWTYGILTPECDGPLIANVSVTGKLSVNMDNLDENTYKFSGMAGKLHGTYKAATAVKNCYVGVAFEMTGSKDDYLADNAKNVNFYGFDVQSSYAPSFSNCYFDGNFDKVWVKNTMGDNAYDACKITVGTGETGSIFYDSTVAPHVYDTSYSNSSRSLTITGKSTDDMKKASTYAGWDTSVWNIADGSYPTLRMPASDISALQAQIAAAEKLSQGDYTAKSWATLSSLLPTAKALTADTLQYKIDKYAAAIQDAISNLVESDVDKSALSSEVAKAEKIATYLYTATSVSPFTTALNNAQMILDGDTYGQAKVDAARDALQNAEAGLVTVRSVLLKSIQQGQAKQQEDGYAAKYADYSRNTLDTAVSDAQTWYDGDPENLTESQQKTLSAAITSAIPMDAPPSLSRNAQGDYTIGSADDLVKLANDVAKNGCYYIGQTILLTDDIDMSGRAIGVNTGDVSARLKGTIDGCGHIIQDYGDITSSVFPKTSGTIKNLTVNFAITYQDSDNGTAAASAFGGWTPDDTGMPAAQFVNCASTGMIAVNTDKLSGSYFSISAFGYYPQLKDCYSRVNFAVTGSGTDKTLILAGLNQQKNRAANCYYAGTYSVDTTKFSKARILPDAPDTADSAGVYYDNELAPSVYKDVTATNGKSSADMKKQSTYAGWDFNVVWSLSPDKNDGYPTLHQTDVTYLTVRPVLADKTWDANHPDDTTATVKSVAFDGVDATTQALIDRYHVTVDYAVQSAHYKDPKGASEVTIEFSRLGLKYDRNDTMDFSIQAVTPIVGTIADPNQSSVSSDTTLNWTGKLGNMELTGISDAKTPRTAAELKEMWAFTTSTTDGGEDWVNEPGTPIIVGDYTFCYIAKKLYKFNTKTGATVAVADCYSTNDDPYFTYPTYTDGKVFVPVQTMVNGTPRSIYKVFDANTLQQLYTMDAENLTSYNGVLYGTYRDYASDTQGFAIFPTADPDPSSSTEKVTPSKIYKTGNGQGVSMSYPVFTGDYALTYDGQCAVSLNLATGKVTRSGVIAKAKDSGGQLNYYEKNSRVYIAAKTTTADDCGSVYSLVFHQSDGSFDMESLKAFNSDVTCGSNSVPIIYNDRVYLCGGGHFMGGGDPFRVLDANTLQCIYSIPDLASKGSVMLTTAYATKENNQTVYLYVVPYGPDKEDGKSKIYIIKDSIGQTTPSYEAVDAGKTQYASQSVAISKDGELVWYNDAKYLYSYGNADSQRGAYTATDVARQITRQPDVDKHEYYNSYEIQRIKERYDGLSQSEQAKVTNYSKLTDILAVLHADPVQQLIDGINALPSVEKITLGDNSTVSSLLAAYNNLDSDSRAKVTNADKLLRAEEKIGQMEDDLAVSNVIRAIDGLPAVGDLTSDDEAKVTSVAAAYGDLSDTLQNRIPNKSHLDQAQARIAAIKRQMADVQALIAAKLDGVTVTLDTRGVVQAIDKACAGLAQSDIAKLTNYEYYVSPAKAEIVNLLIAQSVYVNGKEVAPTLQNRDALQNAINEINRYYAGILDSDKIYVDYYDSVADLQNRLDRLTAPAYDRTVDNDKVRVAAPAGVLPSDAGIQFTSLSVPAQVASAVSEKLGKGAQIRLYFDISLLDGSQVRIQPNGMVKIRIRLDDQYKDNPNLVVVYIADDGTITELPTTIAGGYAGFETNHFSRYALVEKVSSGASADAALMENPKTGDGRSAPVWVLWALPAGAMAMCLYRRKHKKAV